MANSARIDELEKKFSENARRYFAPLANEYRKAGDLARAIEICRAHLPQQPGHMSGHVVYGQALYESRQLEEAKSVFEAALGLDPENLIALRHLGDIARDSGDPATARVWYMRVLDADPRNDEVAGMLAELDAAPPAPTPPAAEQAASAGAVSWGDINPEAAKAPEPSAPSRPSADAAEETEAGTDEPPAAESADVADTRSKESAAESAPRSPAATAASPEAALFAKKEQEPDAGSLDSVLNDAFAEADTQEMDIPAGVRGASKGDQKPPAERSEAEIDDATFAEVDALFDEISPSRGTGSQRAVTGSQKAQPAPGEARKDAPPSGTGDAMFGDDVAAPQPGKGAGIDGLETAEFIAPARAEPEKPARRDTGSMAVAGLTSFDQPTDEDSSTRAAFVTETMAELYLQQGFTAEALDIYRQLLAKNPNDASLRDRVDQLESGGGSSLSIAAVSSEIIEAAKQRHAARPQRTVRSFFGRLAGRRPPHRADHPDASNGDDTHGEAEDTVEAGEPNQAYQPPAEASRPTPFRLDVVTELFGDAAVTEADEQAASTLASGFAGAIFGSDEATQSPPAESPAPPSGRAAHAGGNELSLDQVFRESAPRNPRKSGAYSFEQFFSDGTPTVGPGPARPETPSDESAESPEGDLEQFTAWLEGLKRK
jgi:tetratricopeptide (TPR) repeat protein